MDRTLIVCSSTSGKLDHRHLAARMHCEKLGARVLLGTEISDVTLARNRTLSAALTHDAERDVLLLLDDDIVFTPTTSQALVDYARETGRPVSAVYGNAKGKLCLCGMNWDPKAKRKMVGLGCCAIPLLRLTEYANTLPDVEGPDETILKPLCQSSYVVDWEGKLKWCSEDFWLSRELGGFDLLPLAVKHLKTVPLFPDEITLQAIARPQ